MARDAAKATTHHGGLYDWLAEREERAALNGVVYNAETGNGYTGTPERLASLRAGESVDLPAGALPQHARVGLTCRWWDRATVAPDNTVRFSIDDGSQWLAENGL